MLSEYFSRFECKACNFALNFYCRPINAFELRHDQCSLSFVLYMLDAHNDCVSKPCLNGGHCIDNVYSFTCDCPIGYGGEICGMYHDLMILYISQYQ